MRLGFVLPDEPRDHIGRYVVRPAVSARHATTPMAAEILWVEVRSRLRSGGSRTGTAAIKGQRWISRKVGTAVQLNSDFASLAVEQVTRKE